MQDSINLKQGRLAFNIGDYELRLFVSIDYELQAVCVSSFVDTRRV